MQVWQRLEQLAHIRTQQHGFIPWRAWDWQKGFVHDLIAEEHVCVLKSRDIGSSTSVILPYTWLALLDGGDFIIASKKKDSARQLFEVADHFINRLPDQLWFMRAMKTNTQTEKTLWNGSKIIALENSEQAGRSYRARYLLASEMAFWEHPALTWPALLATCVSGAHICIESTPNPGPSGALFESFTENEAWCQHEHRWPVNPLHTPEWKIAKMIELNGDETKFAQEYECDVSRASGDKNILTYHDIQKAIAIKLEQGDPVVLGVDVARFGSDRSVIAVRKGEVVLPITRVYRHLDTVALATKVKEAAIEEKATGINVDAIGIGAGVVDTLRSWGVEGVQGVNVAEGARDSETYVNLKAELWFALRDRIRDGTLQLPDDKELARELLVTYGYTPSGQYRVQSKEEVKEKLGRSPDKADAVVLTVKKPRFIAM